MANGHHLRTNRTRVLKKPPQSTMEQLTATGRYIGKGNTAEVYQYDSQLVVKLYVEKYGRDLALYEQQVLTAVNRAGAPSPVVHDIVQYGDRFGLKMEFIDGQTLDKIIL